MTIERLDVVALKIPRRRAPALGGRKTDDWSGHVVVRLGTRSGGEGIGEARLHRHWSYETLESAATTLRNYLAPELLGLDATDLSAVHRAMDLAIAPNIARGQPIAKSAVDMALCDLLAKAEGRSLVDWLGGAEPAVVRTNALLSPQSADQAAGQAASALAHGFDSFKLNLGHGRDVDLDMVRAVKEVVGDRYLLAEANQGYDYDTALAVGRGLEQLGVDAFEQPLPANQIAGLRELKDRLGLPVQLDESIYGPEDLAQFLQLDSVGAVTLKVSKAGGLTPARRMAEIGRDAGLVLAGSGLAEAGVGLAASAALFASLGLDRNLTLNGPQLLVSDIVEEELCAADGTVSVPAGTGLGVTLSDEALARFAVEL